jgi:3-oxoacyl-[acyl-carrier protein] reductase
LEKRCLVLGGSGSLGQAVVRALAREGARVVFSYFRGEAAASVLCGGVPSAAAVRVDLTDVPALLSAVDLAAATLGGLDALVCCAAIGVSRPGGEGTYEKMAEIDEAGWDRMMAVNVKASFFATQRALAHMPPAPRGGNVVFVGSVDGIKAVPSPVHYAATRGALVSMARTLSKEHGGRGLRANVVAPGVLDGGMSRAVPDALRREFLKHSAMKRLGAFAEVAELVAWLALENTYVTGQAICLDGGL